MKSLIVIIFFFFPIFCDAQLPVDTKVWHFYHYFKQDNIFCFGFQCDKINFRDAECRGTNFINDFNCKINSNDTEFIKNKYSTKFLIECNYGMYRNRICYLAIILDFSKPNDLNKKEFNSMKNKIEQRFSYLPGNNTIICFNCKKKLIPLVDCIGSNFKNNFNCTGKGISKQGTFFSINCNSNCFLGIYLNNNLEEKNVKQINSNFTILIGILCFILVLLSIGIIYFLILYYKNRKSANFSQ